MIKKYVKKQLPVEAILWNGDNFEEIKEFILSKKPDYIVHEPFVAVMKGKHPHFVSCYKKGDILFYDKKKEKDVFKYGKDRLNDKSVFGVLPLGYYVYFDNEKGYHETVSKAEFEAEYEQQDGNHASKPSNFSLRDLVMQIAPKHIKYYVKRLEKYGFKLIAIKDVHIQPEGVFLSHIVLKDKNGYQIWIHNRKGCGGEEFGLVKSGEYNRFEVKNNNWREAFKKLVASFPDEIMKNTNHHNINAS